MDEGASKEMLELIRRKAERVSGKPTSAEDVRQMCIENLAQRRDDEVRNYLNALPLEHILHLIAANTGD